MSKQEEYLKLSIPDRVGYINNQLTDGKSLNSIGKDLDIRESTIRQQFNTAGYKRVGKQFILTEKQIGQNVQIESTAQKLAQEEESAPYQVSIKPDEFQALVGRVEVLEQALRDALDQVARAAGSRRIVLDLPEETQEIRNTFRLNGTVFQQWQELLKNCPGVTAKDLMSQALWEYINRHAVD